MQSMIFFKNAKDTKSSNMKMLVINFACTRMLDLNEESNMEEIEYYK